MQQLAVAVYQLPEWLAVKGLKIECAEDSREVPLPLHEGDAVPPVGCPTTITIDFAPER